MAKSEKRSNQNIVGSLADAIARREHFQEAVAFSVAPLKVRSGARSWHGINSKTNKWEKEHSEGTAFPDVDEGDEVPQLPPSPIGIWEFCFIDKGGEILRPTITIDPTYNVGSSAAPDQDEPAPERGAADRASAYRRAADPGPTDRGPGDPSNEQGAQAPRVDPSEGQSPGSMLAFMLEMVRQKDRHALLVLQAAQANQQSAWDKLTGLVEIHEGMHARNEALRDQAIAQLKEAVGVNADLSNRLLEAQQDGQLHLTIRELFAGKPELLITSFRELLIGIVDKLKT